MTGSFVKGVPHGAFRVAYQGLERKTSLTANYKNGVLVGAYSCSLLDDDARLAKYSGVLTQEGKFTGEWNLNGVNAQFQNGVLVYKKGDNVSTRPALVELSKKYASKNITKEDLDKKNIIVKTETVKLGNYARIAVFRDSGVEFKNLGGYDFSLPNEIKYEWLDELLGLTDEGFALLTKQIVERVTNTWRHDSNVEEIFSNTYGIVDKYPAYIFYDKEYDRYYVVVYSAPNTNPYRNKKYIAGAFELRRNQEVYLSSKQLESIDEQMDIAMKEHAVSLKI